jgi:predicted RNase H-like nuclease (RuvC/YqgF family)
MRTAMANKEFETVLKITKCANPTEIYQHLQGYRAIIARLEKTISRFENHPKIRQCARTGVDETAVDERIEQLEVEWQRLRNHAQALTTELEGNSADLNNQLAFNSNLKQRRRCQN